jgi:4-hydroxybenzoate polyprenyltransferase
MFKINPSQIRTFVALLALLALIIYNLSDKMIEKGLFTKDTVTDLLYFLIFIIVVLAGFWVYNNIAEKEIDAENRAKSNKTVVSKSKQVNVINKTKGNETSIEDSEDVRIDN